jgi:hypothetical protein
MQGATKIREMTNKMVMQLNHFQKLVVGSDEVDPPSVEVKIKPSVNPKVVRRQLKSKLTLHQLKSKLIRHQLKSLLFQSWVMVMMKNPQPLSSLQNDN